MLFPKKSLPSPMSRSFIPLYQTLKEEIIILLYSLLQKTEIEGILPNSFYEVSIIPIPNPKTLQENYRPISHEHKCKTLQQNISKYDQTMHEMN